MKGILTIGLAFLLIQVTFIGLATDDSPPLPPNKFYGYVYINNEPAPPGTKIEAYIDNELRGSITLTKEGKFGYDLNYLSVEGSEKDDGKTIIFKVNNTKANETAEWIAMAPPREIDLHVSKPSEGGGGANISGEVGGGAQGGGGGGGGATPPENHPPVAVIDINPSTAYVNENITFDASQSYDPDGDPLTYLWDLGDGTKLQGKIVTHKYSEPGVYRISLKVEDGRGGFDTAYEYITIKAFRENNPPLVPTINGPTSGKKNTSYSYTFASTDPDNDDLQYLIDWGDGKFEVTDFFPSGSAVSRTHSWSNPGIYTIKARAFDNESYSDEATLTVYIDVKTIGNLGYLIDTNSDGIYDLFHSNATGIETEVIYLENGTYKIDVDGDGKIDYLYNPSTNELYEFKEKIAEKKGKGAGVLLPTVLVIIAIIVIVSTLVIAHRRGKKVRE